MKIKTQFVFTHSPDMILKAIENPKDPIIFHLSDDERIELITLAEMCVGANLDPHNEKELAQAVSYAEADLSSAITPPFCLSLPFAAHFGLSCPFCKKIDR